MRNRTGPTLLIADDDRKGVRAIANVASGLGLGFVTATAWREFFRGRFDLVITDLNMPGGDGGVLARRGLDRPPAPVILLSELGEASLAICDIEDPVGIEVVDKPLVPATLRAAIERQLEVVVRSGQSIAVPGA